MKNHQIFDKPLLPPLKSEQFYFQIFLLGRWNSLSVQNLRSGRLNVQILVIKDRVLLIAQHEANWDISDSYIAEAFINLKIPQNLV